MTNADSFEVPEISAWLGESEAPRRMSLASKEYADEIGVGPNGDTDVMFVGFLRSASRFGVFTFGPISIYVPAVEAAAAKTIDRDMRSAERLVRYSGLLRDVQRRLGGPLNELHLLLAFMRMNEGLPARVFGELGVRPEQVEEYARSAGTAGSSAPPEKLYSPEEAAEYLGIHVQTVRAWIRSGRLKASRLAGQRALRIKASDLMTVLEPVDAGDAGV